MATNLKAKKKKGTYDNKLILWISIGLAAFVALVVGIFLIVTYTTNYVAKVDGMKIYTYEYNYFLRQAISEAWEAPEGYDEMSTEEQNKLWDEFYTKEKKKECQETALENARKFKAQYRLARNAGFKLSAKEKADVKATVDYYYNYYMSSGASSEVAIYYITGGSMTLSEYKDFSILQTTIEKYKSHLKEDYTVTLDEMREVYDEAPDDYRTITGRVYEFDLPTMPSVPKDDKGNEIKEDTEDEKLKEKYKEYQTALANFNTQIQNYEKLANEIMQALEAEDGKYTLYQMDMLTYEHKKDKDGKELEPIVKDADFATLAAYSAWSSASTNKGVFTVGAGTQTNIAEIDDYILQMQWNEDRNGFIFVEKKDEEGEEEKEEGAEDSAAATSASEDSDTTKEDEDKVTPSSLKLIRVEDEDGVLTALYIVRVEDITDFDSEPTAEAEGDEEALNSIQTSIKSTLLEEKAVADLDAKVEKAGKKFAVKSKKQDRMDEILKKVM